MKNKILSLFLIIIFFITGCGKNSDAITFQDSKLEKQLKEELNLKGDLKADDLGSLESLTVSKDVKSLKGLEAATNLTSLDLSNVGDDFDFTSLRLLDNLTSLTIKNLDVGSLGFIKTLDSLTYLTLTGCNFKELRYLTALSNLTYLNLSDNKITDLTEITKLEKLEKLNLKGNDIKDISDLTSLTNLKEVKLDDKIISSNSNIVTELESKGVIVLNN